MFSGLSECTAGVGWVICEVTIEVTHATDALLSIERQFAPNLCADIREELEDPLTTPPLV